jgi:hypothetical protein
MPSAIEFNQNIKKLDYIFAYLQVGSRYFLNFLGISDESYRTTPAGKDRCKN